MIDTRTRLLEAALQLFSRKGFAGVSVRDLAEEAGVNSALISYHFGSKEGLYRALLEEQFEQALETVHAAAAQNRPPLDRIADFARAMISLHRKNPALLRLVNTEITTPTACFDDIIRLRINRNFEFLCQTLREGIETGEIKQDIQPEYAAFSLVGMINFYFLAKPLEQRLITLDQASDIAYGEQAIRIYLNGIRRKADE